MIWTLITIVVVATMYWMEAKLDDRKRNLSDEDLERIFRDPPGAP